MPYAAHHYRERMRAYFVTRIEKRKARGDCIECGKRKAERFVKCLVCRKRRQDYYRTHRK
jgi:hypothetical protein